MTYPRRILLAVTGLSPQVVTETLYALGVAAGQGGADALMPTEVHLITTAQGAKIARTALLHPDGNALRRDDGLEALFAHPAGTRLLGIMDDAAAVIVQAVAGSRGARTLAHGEHRGAAGTVRHCCSVTAHDAPIRWREAAHGPQPHLERFYLAALGVGLPAHGAPAAAAGSSPPDSLASFLLQL